MSTELVCDMEAGEMKTAERGQWLTLATFAFHAVSNQFLFMDFAPVSEITKETFDISDAGVNWLYTVSLLAAIPSLLFVMSFIDSHNWLVSFFGVTSTVAAAWLRLASVHYHSFELAVVSSVALGLGVGTIFTGFTELPARCFPEEKDRAIAAAIAAQSAFFGWAAGGLMVPLLIISYPTMKSFFWVQAIAVTLGLPIFCFGHSTSTEAAPSMGGGQAETTYGSGQLEDVQGKKSEDGSSIVSSVASMFLDTNFALQANSIATLEAVGFTIPAVQEAVLADEGYSHIDVALFGFCFIFAGVIVGLAFGEFAPRFGNPRKIVLGLFWTGALAIGMLCGLVFMTKGGKYFLAYFFLLVIGGGCSLGFVNVALPIASAALPGKPESHTGGYVGIMALALAALLTQFSTGRQFTVCAIAALFAAIGASLSIPHSHSA